MNAKRAIWVVLGVAVIVGPPSTATSAEGLYLPDSSPGYRLHLYLPRSVYGREHIPYFALHPPVYYSYPVPRPYGYSPYAYPPGTMTPKFKPNRPVVIQNRYVPTEADIAAKPNRTARAPLMITNPHVVPSALAENRSGHGREKR